MERFELYFKFAESKAEIYKKFMRSEVYVFMLYVLALIAGGIFLYKSASYSIAFIEGVNFFGLVYAILEHFSSKREYKHNLRLMRMYKEIMEKAGE